MSGRPFVDSNVLIYAYSDDPRSAVAQAVCAKPHVIAVQSLNEFAAVAHRKLGYGWERVGPCLDAIVDLADLIMPLTIETHSLGIALAKRYKLQIHDSLIVAAALETGCDLLLSEDMQDGLVIEEALTIRNPFR